MTMTDNATLLIRTVDAPPEGRAVEIGGMVSASAVQASNLLKDVREIITNALGGRMTRYERLLDTALTRAQAAFRAQLAAEGYDGAVGVRITTSTIVQGGAEIIVYGTGFRYLDAPSRATEPAAGSLD